MLRFIFLLTIFIQLGSNELQCQALTKTLYLTQQRRAKLIKDRFFKKMARDYPQDIIIKGPTDQKKIALTFDDGPDAREVPRILDILKYYQIKATFFFVGERIKAHKEIVIRAHQEGHLVLNHSWSHQRFSTLTPEKINDEVVRTQRALDTLVGHGPLFIRLPYGDFSNRAFQALKMLGYKIIFWSLDASAESKDTIIKNIISSTGPGEIILMHSSLKLESGYNDSMITSEALPTIIEALIKEGYNFVSIKDFC